MYDFDQIIDRRDTHSSKWSKFPPDVLPMWVADMDFAAPEFVLDVLRQRLQHPVLGYTNRPPSLMDAFRGWLEHHYGWSVPASWVVWLPGVVPALNLAAQILPHDQSIMIPTPVYHPFLDLAANARVDEVRVPMTPTDGLWRMDFERMARALKPHTRMLLICNPQNPTGRCYSREDLALLAHFVESHDLYLVSDEIHCNIVIRDGACHTPIAAAFPEIARRTISLYAATKVYNIPGVSCAAAVIPESKLRQRFMDARRGLVPGIGPLAFAASEAAFNDRSTWVRDLQTYLRANFTLIQQALGPRVATLEGTYLAWIDVGDLELDDAESYFAEHGLGISPGAQFGEPRFIRLNFGCPRTTLREGIRRLQAALTG